MEWLAYLTIISFLVSMGYFIYADYIMKKHEFNAWVGFGFLVTIVLGVVLALGVILGG